jgi:hypothetical protein
MANTRGKRQSPDVASVETPKQKHASDRFAAACAGGSVTTPPRSKPGVATTPEEHALLEREVNNGGYNQFFVNSSCQYALTVVAALRKVGCDATTAVTEEALRALNQRPLTLKAIENSILMPDRERDQVLRALGQQFYRILEIEQRLFAFVESHAQAFVVEKMHVAPRPSERGNRNLIKLGVGLMFAAKTERTFEEVGQLAVEIAIQKEIEPTDMELDGAAYLFLFESLLKKGTWRNAKGLPDKPST